VLALSIGFFLYRAGLVAVPSEQYLGSPSMICPEGNVPRPVFDLLTGLPDGVVVGCANRDGVVGVMTSFPMLAHWQRSMLLGFAGAALGLMMAWWSGRRRRSALQRRSQVPTSA
jgi:hypothetical protein